MLVVKIELWPHGDESRAEEIGRTYIHNVGGTQERGNYAGFVCRKGVFAPFEKAKLSATRTLEVKDYPRLSYNVWRLILRSLAAAFPEEKSAV